MRRSGGSSRTCFAGYVSPNVLQDILGGQLKPDQSGTRKRICVLFSDVRNFTSRSENRSPEEIIEMLNDYFEKMSDAVHRHEGTVDKYIGDGLMAFFGAPNSLTNASQNAYLAARDMLRDLETLNLEFAGRNIEPVEIGIGLHTGDAVVGHVGSRTRHEYTAIGDVVNTASRLEGLCKSIGYPLIISATTAAELEHAGDLVSLGEQALKGRAAENVFGWQPREGDVSP